MDHGLTSEEVNRRLKETGANEPAPLRRTTAFTQLLHLFASPLIAILLVASLISGIAGEWLNASIILVMEILVAPVALYPDAILRDLFRASTHPFEIAQANQWVHQARDAGGSLPPGGYNENWDSSVKALTAYPELLQRMTADTDWMMKLGTTYVAQPIDVLSAVQRLRTQATSLRSPTAATVVALGR